MVNVYQLTSLWNEAQATWDEALASQPWNSAGGDYNNNAIISFVPLVSGDCYVPLDIGSLVQGWFDGSIANRGLILIADGPGGLQSRYTAKENESHKGPILFITMNP